MEPTSVTSPSARPDRSPSATPALSDQRGFTLIEAMVAMFICCVGLMAMAELMAVTLRMQQLGRNSTQASRLAQDKVDELTTVGFLDARMACGGSLTADQANHNDRPAEATNYKRRWVVSAGPDAQVSLRAVTVRVIPDVSDRTKTAEFDLQTIIRWSGAGAAVCP
jgi:prepilin-type N-terminal cleavage/methylation domain-containing protein